MAGGEHTKDGGRRSGRAELRSPGPSRPARSHLLSGRTRWIARGVLVLLPFLLFGGLEGIFRIAGVAKPEPLFIRVKSGPLDVYQVNPRIGRRFFPPSMERIMPSPGFQIFPVRKDPGAFRIFILGESTAAGFPFHTHGAFSSFLQDRLAALLPGRRFEVVNCAMTAINSYAVADFAREVRAYQPDLLVLYLGHNEYYGAFGPASTASFGRGGAAVGALRFVYDLRVVRALRGVLERSRGVPPVKGKTVMEAMAGKTGIRRGDRVDRAALAGFARNLERAVRSAGAPVVLCEQVSNLRDLPPFESTHRPGMLAASQEEFRTLLARVKQAASGPAGSAARVDPETLAQADRLVASDSTYAEARFLRARLLDALGRYSEAARDYRAARDLDGIPFRAPAEINAVIRRTAARSGAVLAPVEQAFDAAARNGIPGNDLFYEHLHPRAEGQDLIAGAVVRALYDRGLVAPCDAWHREADGTATERIARAGLTPLDLEIADQRVFALTHKWPFPENTAASYRSARDPEAVALARGFIEHKFELTDAHAKYARILLDRGEVGGACEEYRTLCRIFPVVPANFAAAGDLLMKLQRPQEAAAYYGWARNLDPRNPRYGWGIEEATRAASSAGPAAGAAAVGAARPASARPPG